MKRSVYKKIKRQIKNKGVLFLLLFLLSSIFFFVTIFYLKRENVALLEKIKDKEEKIKNLSEDIKLLKEELKKKDELIDTHKKLITALRKDNQNLEKEYNSFLKAVNEAAKSVELFKKKAEADKMLLAKYSKVFFLNEHYAPAKLKLIDSNFVQGNKNITIKEEIYPFLIAMLKDMRKAGLDPKIVSAYRSFEEQKHLKGRYLRTYGIGANQFSADQGYSEHQLGTTIDIINNGNTLSLDFENTDEFQWLQENAWRYGFILSYPKGNKYYIYEPWHWRFVGKGLAKYLNENNLHFYDLPQNKIYDYLINIFDNLPKLD